MHLFECIELLSFYEFLKQILLLLQRRAVIEMKTPQVRERGQESRPPRSGSRERQVNLFHPFWDVLAQRYGARRGIGECDDQRSDHESLSSFFDQVVEYLQELSEKVRSKRSSVLFTCTH